MKASDTSTSIVSHRTLLSPARPVVSSVWARRLGCLLLLGGSLAGGQAQTANWTGGNSFLSYGTAANWSPATVPLNQVGLNYTVIGTPGHSPGSVCFHFPTDRVLFSGDTLFQGTVGRTDLPGGDGSVLTQSLRKLAQLPPETRIRRVK